MVNEEKVKLMARLAMYEESTGREDLEKGKYFQHDYVKYNCLKTLVSTTVLFVIIFAAYVYYNMEELITQLVDMDFFGLAYELLIIYAVVCLVFMLFAWLLYTYRYRKAKPKLIKYNRDLKKLIEFYEKEDRAKAKNKRRSK